MGLRGPQGCPIVASPGPCGDVDQLRLRVGEYRVFYVVDEDIVYITDIPHRSHAYD